MEPGVRSTGSALRLTFRYDRGLSPLFDLDEARPGHRALGIAGRLAKAFFIDLPLIAFHQTVTHEVFGHGARGRESGLLPTYQLRLPAPYQWIFSRADEPSGVAHDVESGDLERDLAMTVGGLESDYTSAWWAGVEMVQQDGWMHYSDAMRYGVAKMSYFDRLAADLSEPPDPSSISDPENYVTSLQMRFGRWSPEDRVRIAGALRRAYIWNFTDPTLWVSAYFVLVRYLILGERSSRVPFIPLGDARLWISTRFNLTSFGAEHYLDTFVRWRGLTIGAYGRAGSSGLASYWGLGGRVLGVTIPGGLEVGVEFDAWTQPEIHFGLGAVTRNNSFGFNAAAHFDWRIYQRMGLTGKVGFKTRGQLMGQPVDEGFYAYLGVSIATSDGPSLAGAWNSEPENEH